MVATIKCGCGLTFVGVDLFFDHRESAMCPVNAPESSDRILTWINGAGRKIIMAPKTEAQRERLERRLEAARAMKDNPVYAENRRRKQELARMERQRKGFFTEAERDQIRSTASRRVAATRSTTITQGEIAMQNENTSTPVVAAPKSEVKPKAAKKVATPKAKAEKKAKAPKAAKVAKVKKEAGPIITTHTPVGTMLRREYKGGRVEVEVLASGFRVNDGPGATKGKTYNSLAACAEAIVGYRISGHNFFGMWLGKGKTIDAAKAKEIAAKEKAAEKAEEKK